MFLAVVSLLLMAGGVAAQDGAVWEPGARVRATVPSDVLPPSGGVFIGNLVSVGDTLAIRIESGAVMRLAPDMLVGLDVSEGQPRFAYSIPAVGAGVGLASGIPIASAIVEKPRCSAFCMPARSSSSWKLRQGIVIGVTATAGFLLGAVIARAQSREEWRPERRVRLAASPSAVSLRVAL